MATAQQTMRLVASRTGFDFGHVRNIGRRLIETDSWPASNGSTVPELEAHHIVLLLLALLAGAEAKSATSVARHYSDLRLVGKDKNDGTEIKAGRMVENMLTTFLDQAKTPFSQWAYASKIELCATTPAIRIFTPCNDRPHELAYLERDAETAPWDRNHIQKWTTLPGKVLFDIAADINSISPLQRTNVPHYVR